MSALGVKIPEGIKGVPIRVARARYDFARHGGAVATIPLVGKAFMPVGAVIIGGYIEVVTAVLSGGAATVAVQAEGANDIVPAVGKASWTVGRHKIVPTLAGASDLSAPADIKLTANRDVSIVVATAALTAGKFDVVLYYHDPLK